MPAHLRKKTIAIAGRLHDASVGEAIATLSTHLLGGGHEVRLPPLGSASEVPSDWRYDETFVRGADLVVAIGGDGTMLHAARAAAMAGVPVLGVNRGRLGFLADVSPERMLESVEDALADRCQPDPRMLLSATISVDGEELHALALNDVAIAKRDTGRMVDLRTWIDGVYVNTHGADHRRDVDRAPPLTHSCGGPIVQPSPPRSCCADLPAHPVHRPIVIAATSVVELELAER
jgi:NAD+ kinase